MISKIEVKKLFGVFDHQIPLTENNGITLILGQNGLGKTIILKLVKAFFDGNFYAIQESYFDEFIIGFTDGTKITIKRLINENEGSLLFELEFPNKKKILSHTFTALNESSKRRKFNSREEQMMYERRIYDRNYYPNGRIHYSNDMDRELDFIFERYLPVRLERIEPNRWVDYNTNSVYTKKEILNKYLKFLPKDVQERFGDGIPEWLTELTYRMNVKLIETQRLLVQADEGKYRSSVTNYSNQLIDTIKNKRSEATDLGSNLDRTYPTRVISEIANSNNVSNNFITSSFKELQEKRALLNNVGLLDTEEEDFQPNINQTFDQKILKEVLSVYIDDSNKKLAIYDDLSKRIKLLLDIINKRFTYKKLSIDKNKGFVFTSTINSKEIPVGGLSSGEQHELVLYFELLFNTDQNSLLLIDEPEISLHISWQKQFIKDLSSVTTLNNLSVIIATHSPDIIGNHWPLTVQLKGIN